MHAALMQADGDSRVMYIKVRGIKVWVPHIPEAEAEGAACLGEDLVGVSDLGED